MKTIRLIVIATLTASLGRRRQITSIPPEAIRPATLVEAEK